ncbi:hypothetical protein GUJ93_ZPchr0009g186 [Zizania palustris]|uniref:AT3G52170-like helix-turn-helix domain-containing protein n=1 Tax=Zizania palustris TaxID=103762 RepID=A0A8J5RGH7_ZIZPA|nr:hypothetical protein GUJ93_ZPchr0009g186 [Zizania palustris]
MQAAGSVSWVAQAPVLACGGVVARPSWSSAAAGSGRFQGFRVVRCCVLKKKPRVRKTKEERRKMVESFVNTYRISNDGKFPSVNLTHKEVGGSYYIVREIVRDIIQENRVLGPGGLNAKTLSYEDLDSSELPVWHELGQESIEILDISDENQVGKVTDKEEVWSLQNNVMSTQQLLEPSNLLEAGTLNSAVQNGNVEDVTCLETNHEKEDEAPCGKSTEIDLSTSENQAPLTTHASHSEKVSEMDNQEDAHETTISVTNGVIPSSEPSAVCTNGALPQDDGTLPDDCHDDTINSAIDEVVLLQEHETLPESGMRNDVQNIDDQLNSTMDAFNSTTSYPETEDAVKSIEMSEVQRLQDEFEQSIIFSSPDGNETAENIVSHPKLDTKVLHPKGKHIMVEEDNSELKQSISAITKQDGNPEHGVITAAAISSRTGKAHRKNETDLFWLIVRAFVVDLSKIWTK